MTLSILNLSTATPDEVFRHVAEHLLSQKCRAKDGDQCRYRIPTNIGVLKCAAGCLIPDALYLPEMEGRSWNTLVLNISIRQGFPQEHRQLIVSLQQVHDMSTPERWQLELRIVAKNHNLSQSTQDWIASQPSITEVPEYEITN